MSPGSDSWNLDMSREEAEEQKARHAAETGAETDPLAAAVDEFEASGMNPFGVFLTEWKEANDRAESTVRKYERVFEQWIDHMLEQDRHPACPHTRHVTAFIDRLLDVGPYEPDPTPNSPNTVQGKLTKLVTWYGWMQSSAGNPHYTNEFNPFDKGRGLREARLESGEGRSFPHITTADLRDALSDVTHIRDRALLVLMLKLGLRAGEVRNMRLSEVDIQHTDLQDHYAEMGEHSELDGRENAVYVPHDREGNKSDQPRVLPLDRETRDVLRTYLVIRPDVDAPQVFLSVHGNKLTHSDINRNTWREAFEGTGTRGARDVTSHFGRHFFSNYWETKLAEEDLPLKYAQYLRGDKISATKFKNYSIDDYLRAHYEDVEPVYREHMFSLRL